MDRRRVDIGAVFLHLAVVAGMVGGVLLLLRQVVPSLTMLAVAVGLAALGKRTPPPADPFDDRDVLPPIPIPDPPRDRLPSGSPHVEASEAPSSSARDGEPVIPRLVPPPAGRPADVWAPATRRVRVVTGTAEAPALDRVRRRGPLLRAVLASDLAGPHHPYDVAVFVEDEHVGDLGGDAVLDYGPRLAALAVQGVDVRTQAFLMPAGLDIALPEPEGLVPVNDVPPGVVLPHGMPLTVLTGASSRPGNTPGLPKRVAAEGDSTGDPTGDEVTEDPAARLLRRYARPGEDVWLAVTLVAEASPHRGQGIRGINVLLDGVTVGRLAPADVGDIAPLLTYLGDRHLTAVAAAVLRGSSLHSRLTVSCIRAQDADEEWLRHLGRA